MINPFRLETHKERMVKDALIDFQFYGEKNHHDYFSRDKSKYTSITTMLKDLGISPSYKNVSKQKLNEAKEYGKLIHSQIENYCKLDDKGFTSELQEFIKWSKKQRLSFIASEYLVHNSELAGAIDLIYQENGELVISDIKTTSQIHKDSVSWQLSLYRYLLGERIEKATCIHIRPDLFEVVEIPLKSNEECENLIKSYLNDTRYQVDLLKQKDIRTLIELQAKLKALDEEKKKIEAIQQRFKEQVCEAMQDRGLLKVELIDGDNKLTFNLILSKDKETIDINKLKKEHPELDLTKYTKYTKVKPYVKVS